MSELSLYPEVSQTPGPLTDAEVNRLINRLSRNVNLSSELGKAASTQPTSLSLARKAFNDSADLYASLPPSNEMLDNFNQRKHSPYIDPADIGDPER